MSDRNKEAAIGASVIVISVVLAILALFAGLILVDTYVASEGGKIIGNLLVILAFMWASIFAFLRG